jgi:hypothetical protein
MRLEAIMTDSAEQHDGEFLYDAFISYRHVERDRKWAEWLIDALERYRVPKALQEKGLPPRLRKIFRDEDEAPASADLNDQIKKALKASRYLIVVCSPYTPRSRWVTREIEIFNELGRGDRVLALLTEGEPNDSFPAALLESQYEEIDPTGAMRFVADDKQPLAADIRPRKGQSTEKLKRLALLRLVAVILGVKFDDLRQRNSERERKHRTAWLAIAATLCLVIAGGTLGYWHMMQPKVAYYRQLVWRWGLPEGLGPVDEETRSHRFLNYQVVTQRAGILQAPRVVEVRVENSAGTLSTGHSLRTDDKDHARWVVRYREDGSTEKIEVYDPGNRLVRDDLLRRQPSTNRLIVTFERNNVPLTQSGTQALLVDPLRLRQQGFDGRSEITRHELTFDQDGFVSERLYQDYWGTPRRDAEGSFGERFVHLPSGLLARRAPLGPDGREMTLKTGLHAITYSYDGSFNLVRQTVIGADGKPFGGAGGFAYYHREFDRWGNDIATSYYDVSGRPALVKDGYAKVTTVYDERGNDIEQAFFGTDGKPALNKDGYAELRLQWDERGNWIEEAFFGVDGQPTLHKDGNAIWRRKFDARGNIVEESLFGVDGQPTLRKDGYAKSRVRYDDRGNLIELAYFGIDGRPTLHKDGNATYRARYDERGNVVEVAYFGIDGRPTLHKDGNAGFRARYDERGNLIEVAYFGIDGQPTLHKDGNAIFRRKFDERGNLIEVTYFGIYGRPTLYKDCNAT